MPRGTTFPRASRGDTLYRVEWTKGKPSLISFVVVTGAASSIVVKNSAGKEQILVGKATLSQFALTKDGAIARDFSRIAMDVVKGRADALKAIHQSRLLSDLL